MFNKNVFTQKDPIADIIKDINEADYKAKMEALKGNQHKIDKNKNNKIDAHDFKILRGEKKVNEEEIEEGWDDMLKAAKERSGPQPSGGSGIKQGSRYGGSKQKDKPEHDDEKVKKEEIDPNKVTTDTLAGQVKGKTSNPFLSKKVMMDVAGNVKEEAEQIDELSNDTLNRYVKKAKEVSKQAKWAGSYGADRDDWESGQSAWDKHLKLKKGIAKAQTKLAKEEAEQVDERELSKGETAEKERIVKGMKKSLAGFKARYGDKAKSVMYATATKQAKKD
jgi:hypothetical protein